MLLGGENAIFRVMLIALLFLSISFLAACSNSVGASASHDEKPFFEKDSSTEMVHVNAGNALAVLGTNSDLAKVNERPQMQVSLNYGFSMGRHEVTCGEFNELMKTFSGLELECGHDSLPATNLTFYDAVLFANERSKAERLDTVYSYSGAIFDNERHCTNLEGFVFHPEVDAYRLPTEAEWVLAAVQNWNPQNAWTAENSDYKLHKVCGKADSTAKFCDMVGNAMEWVNDWLGGFRDTTLSNYVGAPDGGSLGQRIVKGGSFRNTASSITLYGRGDVYTVTSSTRADYVGFRIAKGSIPSAVWMGTDGKAGESRVALLASSATMRSVMGTYKVKLAFRNDLSGNLAYVDYSGGILSVVEILDSIEVYHPEISPDGKRVAFCTGLEGVSGKSELYVRDLNADGSNLVKLKVESAAIPRWRVLENGDTVIVYVTDAGNNKDETSFKSTSTWQVKFSNGKFGTPQKLFDGAYHGGISEDNTLAVTGARLLRARIAKKGSTLTNARDTIWYKDGVNAEQACNVSLSKDGSKRTAFLDFGGKTGRAFVGKSYATHERLLIADSTGTLQMSVAAPSGFTFDHSEWATGAENKVVATLTNVNGAHQKVVLVDLADSSVVDLLEGDELWHPSLWVNGAMSVVNVVLDKDSAGFYMREGDAWGVALMRQNMELLWQYKDSVDVAVVGSSRSMFSTMPSLMSDDFFMVNFSQTPNSIHMSKDFLDLYLFHHLKKLKYVIVSLDFDFWFKMGDEESDNFFQNTYRSYPGYVYDKNHNYWQDGYPEGLLEYTKNDLNVEPYLQFETDRGALLEYFCGGWRVDDPLVEVDTTAFDSQLYLYENSLNSLIGIIESAQNRGVTVIGVVFPQNPYYKNTGSFGRYGTRRSLAEKYISYFEELASQYSNFIFLDENKMGNHEYRAELFADEDHLCVEGAKVFSAKLDSLLRTLK